MKKQYLLLIAAAIVLLSGCNKTPQPIDTSVPATTKIIQNQVWQSNFTGIDSASNTLYFSNNLTQNMPLKKGDVIVSTSGNGLLRKVSNITVSGDSLIVQTTFANLTDVVNKGKTSFSETLSEQKIRKINYLKEGVVLDTSQMKSSEDTQLNYSLDTYLDAGHKIHITGDFSLLTDLSGQLEIGYVPPRIKLFEITYGINQDLNLADDIQLVDLSYEKEVPLASVDFQPIIAVISGVPIVLIPQLEISAGVSTNVHCNLQSEINQHMDYTIGVKYEDHQWSPVNEMNKSFSYSPPQLNCNATAQVYIKPQFNVLIYDVAAPYVYADLYGRIEADINQNPWWNLYAGADMGIGVKARILGATIFDFNTDPPLISYEQLIASAAVVTDPPVAAFTATPTSGTAPLTVNFTDQSTNTPTSWQWDFGDGNSSTQQNPSHTYNNAGSYSVTLSISNSYGNDTKTHNNYITVSNSNNAGVLWNENFDSYELNQFPPNWIASGNGDQSYVTNESFYSSPNSLSMEGISGGSWEGVMHREYDNTYTHYQFEFKYLYTGEGQVGLHQCHGVFSIRSGASWNSSYSRAFVRFDTDNNILCYPSLTVIGSYTVNNWVKIRVDYQILENSVLLKYYVDDQLVHQENVDKVIGEEQLKYFTLESGDTRCLYDDIVVSN